jgi:mono/diheme cytochrome c family protein
MAIPTLRTTRCLALLGFMTLAVGCRSSESDDGPELSEDLVPPVAGISDSVLAALPPGASMETLREGRDHYAPCLVCHGAEAEGTQLGPPFRPGAWVHSDGTIEGIERVIRSGIDNPRDYPVPMPAMGGGDFDEEALRSLATYVYALSLAH